MEAGWEWRLGGASACRHPWSLVLLAGARWPPFLPDVAPPSSFCATRFFGTSRKCWAVSVCPAGSEGGPRAPPAHLGGEAGGLGSLLAHPRLQREPLRLPLLHAGPAPLDACCPLPLAPVARGQPQMAPWPRDKGHTVPGPGLASGWVTLSPSVPVGGEGQTAPR